MASNGAVGGMSARGIHRPCASLRTRTTRTTRIAVLALSLALAASGCSTAGAPDPTGSPSPLPSTAPATPSEWGTYGNRDDACSAVAGDVVALALVPNNLALVDSAGLDGIEQQIQGLSDAAPAALTPTYQQILALTRSFGAALDTYEAEVAASASPSATSPGSSTAPDAPGYTGTPKKTPGTSSGGGSGSGTGASAGGEQPGDIPGDDVSASTSPTPDPGPTRPIFETTLFNAQVDGLKQWLGEICAG